MELYWQLCLSKCVCVWKIVKLLYVNVGCGGSIGRVSALKSSGFHDRFESHPEHKNKL